MLIRQIHELPSNQMLIDSHCHIQQDDYPLDKKLVLQRAAKADVTQIMVVGVDFKSSKQAIDFAAQSPNIFASVGVHPHESKFGFLEIKNFAPADYQAIGEIGLDYFYHHSNRDQQIKALAGQIEIALQNNKPIIFHVREAFDDFWPIFDSFKGIRGVLHSFSDSPQNLEKALSRDLMIGVNGISTFTKNAEQQTAFKQIPLDKMLLETDAPFLTPVPFRGKINEPAFVRNVAEFHAAQRNLKLEVLAAQTSQNARQLFGF